MMTRGTRRAPFRFWTDDRDLSIFLAMLVAMILVPALLPVGLLGSFVGPVTRSCLFFMASALFRRGTAAAKHLAGDGLRPINRFGIGGVKSSSSLGTWNVIEIWRSRKEHRHSSSEYTRSRTLRVALG